MGLIRLGDRLDQISLQRRKPYFQVADNLAKRIFNPELREDNVVSHYVVNSHEEKEAEKLGINLHGNDQTIFNDLGNYERTLIGKLLQPERKILCLVGSIGCGKSTTIKFIVDRLQKKSCQNCLASEKCSGDRIIPIIDFNSVIFESSDEKNSKKELLNTLCQSLRAPLKVKGIPNEMEEITEFWDEQIQRINNGDIGSSSFILIAEKLSQENLLKPFNDLNEEEIDERKEVLENLIKNKNYYLDYLIRLWGYVIRKYYDGRDGCAFLVFDNIDRVNPIVQSSLVSILESARRDPGPTFVVVLRPETFDRLGLGTHVLDVEHHRGPTPSEVIIDRLQRFVDDPDSFYVPEEGLKRNEFLIIKSFLMRVFKIINTDNSPYISFVNNACGKSIRLGLLAAQKVFMVNQHDMTDNQIGVFPLIRITITHGKSQYQDVPRVIIENLFHVEGSFDGRLLIKPRILKLLESSQRHRKSINEIQYILTHFDYSSTALIRPAVNDLLDVYTQLVRSDGFDSYSIREFLSAGNQNIILTEVGIGYLNHLMTSLEYTQEVMLDCYLPPDRFGVKIRNQYLHEKLNLLYKFLSELLDADRKETKHFVTELSRSDYFDVFGKYMISVEIIISLYSSVENVIRSVISSSKSGDTINRYTIVLNDFQSLLNVSLQANNSVLGIWPDI